MIRSSPSCYRELGGSWHGLPFEAQSTAQIFSAESTAAYKEFEQRLAMVICHKLYNSIFQERLWVSILVHDSIRRWILWLFTSTICIPKHQIHATCGGIILPKQQHKKEMLSFNSHHLHFFAEESCHSPFYWLHWGTPAHFTFQCDPVHVHRRLRRLFCQLLRLCRQLCCRLCRRLCCLCRQLGWWLQRLRVAGPPTRYRRCRSSFDFTTLLP